jgi:hypothetical protein
MAVLARESVSLSSSIAGVATRGRLPLFGLALLLPFAVIWLWQCRSDGTPVPPGPVGYGVLEFASRDASEVLVDPQALGINVLLNWSDLEPEEGVYDWSALDQALSDAEAHGKRVAPRVYTNASEFGYATPDWVFDAGAASYFPDDGAEVWQPVPTDPVFREKFGAFLSALGDRYDGHPAIEFFQTNAGMGTFGEMVWGVPDDNRPDGWSARVQIETSNYWIDRWREAFPDTPLVLMENYVGYGILEKVAAHAVERGFYLQANDPYHPEESQDILAKYDGETKIVMEIEDKGCRSALGEAFDETLDRVFDGGFAIDYLTICDETFALEPERVAGAWERLRKPGR